MFRLDSTLPKVRQAKDDVESLWKAYTVMYKFLSLMKNSFISVHRWAYTSLGMAQWQGGCHQQTSDHQWGGGDGEVDREAWKYYESTGQEEKSNVSSKI